MRNFLFGLVMVVGALFFGWVFVMAFAIGILFTEVF